jgi:hypothetical protein
MFLLTVVGKEKEGAFSVTDDDGDQVLYIFEEEDDAIRYGLMLEEENGFPEMQVLEIDDDFMIKICEIHGHRYTIITSNDIVIPPSDISYDTV